MITFDTTRKHIVLDSTYVSWATIWSRWVDWHSDHKQYPLAFSLVGGQALGAGLYIPPYFFLLNGWRVRPMEQNHDLTLVGNGFVEGGGIPVADTLGVFRINVNYTVPVQAQGIAVSGSSGPTAAELTSAIMTALNADLQRLQELYELNGLNPSAPVIVSDSSRSSQNISQTFTDNGTATTIQRV